MSRRLLPPRRSVRSLVEAVEPRILFSYDVGYVDATTTPGVYSPGQSLSATFTFKNFGDVASPETHFFIYLGKQGLTDPSGGGEDPSLYGGIPFDNSGSTGFTLPAIAPGDTSSVVITDPVSQAVFNGGPYGFFVYAGFDDTNFLLADNNPVNNFGLSTQFQVSISGGIGTGSPGGPIPPANPTSVIGDLDTTFGTGGVANSVFTGTPLHTIATVFDTTNNFQYALAQQSTDIALIRFDNNGLLDTNYGNNGVLTINLGGAPATASALTRAPDGSMYIAGTLNNAPILTVVRITPSGDLDTTFAGTGAATLSPNGAVISAPTLVTTPTGQLYVAGTANGDAVIFRLNPDGSGDGSFGAGRSMVTVDFGGDDTLAALTLTSKGEIILAGAKDNIAAAAKLTSAGDRDTKFGTKGLYTAVFRPGANEAFTTAATGAKDVVFLGGYSAVGDTSSIGVVARITSTGKADAKFGTKGLATLSTVTAPLASVNTLTVGGDGGVLISLQTANSVGQAGQGIVGATLVRLGATGKLFTSFGTNGVTDVFALPVAGPMALVTGEFQGFLDTKDGVTTQVPGGKIRALSANSTTDDSSTTLMVAQLVADGVDLVPVFISNPPGSVLGGAAGSIKVQLSNLGTLPATGTANLAITLAAANGTAVPFTDNLGSLLLKLKLNPGSSSKATIKLKYPQGADGLYAMVATVSPTLTTPDIGTTNNAASSANQFTVAPQFSDLGITLGPVAAPVGGKLTLPITIFNSGNFTASGKANVQVFLTSDSTLPVGSPFAMPLAALGIAPGKSKLLKLSVPVVAGMEFPAGSQLYVVIIGPGDALEKNRADNSAFSNVLV